MTKQGETMLGDKTDEVVDQLIVLKNKLQDMKIHPADALMQAFMLGMNRAQAIFKESGEKVLNE